MKSLWPDLEHVEREAWADIYRAPSPGVVEACGIRFDRTGSILVSIASKIDVLAFNRVNGLGDGAPATADMIERIIDLYRAAKVPRFFVQVAPHAQPDGLPELMNAHGLQHYNNWVKLVRDTATPLDARTDLSVETIGIEDAAEFGALLVAAFEWPESVSAWITATVGRDHWTHYVARDHGRMVATAAIYVAGEYGWIDMASTLNTHRGHGAQSALLARRIQDAAKAGCQWLVVETAEQTSDKDAPSYRNVTRFGFQVAYARPNYLKKFE